MLSSGRTESTEAGGQGRVRWVGPAVTGGGRMGSCHLWWGRAGESAGCFLVTRMCLTHLIV